MHVIEFMNSFFHDRGLDLMRFGKMISTMWPLSGSKLGLITSAWTAVACIAVGYLLLSALPSFLNSSSSTNLGPDLTSQLAKHTSSPVPSPSFHSIPPTFSPLVQKLHNDLKQARQAAESDDHQSGDFTPQERVKWASEHPCRARSELPALYASRKMVADAPPNPQWAAVFKEYSQLHRTCMTKISNISDVFGKKRIIPGCKFVTGESLFGLGNKITYAASLVLYAVITKRVVLFPQSTSASIMCEPFEGSSWTLPPDLEYLNRRTQENGVNKGMNTNATDGFLAWVDAANGSATSVVAKPLFHAEADDGWHPVNRFYCDTEQQFLSNVEWISAAGCLYFLPKIYAIPSFRPTLEALFPNPGLTLTYVMRFTFLPGDEAWDRIQRIYEMHLEKADRRVSIQVRYRGGHREHEEYGPHLNAHVTRCLQENGILPYVTEYSTAQPAARSPPFPIVKVMMASLFTDLQDHLSEIYLRHSTVTGESVGLIQISHENEQRFGRDVDTQALVEIICLSLSDVMLVTPLSTFGGTAQAYGALRPWMIEFNDKEQGSCIRSPSVDMCYQCDRAHEILSCPYDLSVNGSHAVDAAQYIDSCSPLESQTGFLLVSS